MTEEKWKELYWELYYGIENSIRYSSSNSDWKFIELGKILGQTFSKAIALGEKEQETKAQLLNEEKSAWDNGPIRER